MDYRLAKEKQIKIHIIGLYLEKYPLCVSGEYSSAKKPWIIVLS